MILTNHARGARHHASKMTAAKVTQARKLYATGKWTQAALAERYGITAPAMWAILNRRTWVHI